MSKSLLQTMKSGARRVRSAARTLVRGPDLRNETRLAVAQRYLQGSGIEIGALHNPLPMPAGVRVRYVDRMRTPQLREQYPELAALPLVDVEIVDDGEKLTSIPSDSTDFVIASHLIEHTQDPLASIRSWLRVIRSGGVLFLAIPLKTQTFDKDRPVTPLEHLVKDHREGPEGSRRAHFEEWVRLVNKTPEKEVESEVERLTKMDYSIHFHVWTEIEFLELLLYCKQALGLPFSIELTQLNGIELIAVLRKL